MAFLSKHWPRWREWTGLVAAGTAWSLHHQLVSDALHFDCAATGGGRDVALGVVALALVALGAWTSWRTWPAPAPGDPQVPLYRFIVALSLMAAALAALAIGLQMVAGVILPGCRP